MPIITFGLSNETSDLWGCGEKVEIDSPLNQELKQHKDFLIDDETNAQINLFLDNRITGEQLYIILRDEGVQEWYMFVGFLLIDEAEKAERLDTLPLKKKKKRKQTKAEKRKKRACARKQRAKHQKVRLDKPNREPLKHFELGLNAGGHCVGKLIDNKEYAGETVQDFIDYSEKMDGNHIIYDAIGRAISTRMNATRSKCPDVVAMATMGHMYPVKSGIILREKKIKYGKREVDVTFEYGTTLPETLDMLTTVKPLMFLTKEKEGFGIDMNECYYTVSQMKANYGIPTVSDYPQAYAGEKIKDHNLYVIETDFVELAKFGFTNNVLSGRCIKLLSKILDITIKTVLDYKNFALWDPKKVKDAFAEIDEEFECEEDKDRAKEWRKEWRVVVGKKGKYTRETQINLQELSEKEVNVLEYDLDASQGKIIREKDGTITYKRVDTKYLNQCHIRTHIVEMANYAVLEKILEIKEKTGQMPIKIKTDGIAYKNKIVIPTGWKYEEFRWSTATINFNEYVHNPQKYENTTVCGKAGTGKTYKCEKMDWDISAAFTNRKAKAINGITLARLFDHFKHGSLAHLEDKVVWVDECFMAPNDYWGQMIDAYMNWNTRFVFSGDVNQLGPVSEKKMSVNPFLGNIDLLTDEHRCDPEIQKIRDNIDAYKPTFEKNTDYPDLNLSWTNPTRKSINECVAARKGIKMCDIGAEVLCRSTEKKYYISNGDLLKVNYNDGKHIGFEESDTKVPIKFFLGGGKSVNFCLAYCITVHCSQGETLDGIVGIHDWNRMSSELKLTAVSRVRTVSQLKFY